MTSYTDGLRAQSVHLHWYYSDAPRIETLRVTLLPHQQIVIKAPQGPENPTFDFCHGQPMGGLAWQHQRKRVKKTQSYEFTIYQKMAGCSGIH